MLTHLSIRNLAVVKALDIDLRSGLTVITGETGAGKSIAIDALGLCLGERAEANMVRANTSKADVTASFDLAALPKVTQWLIEHDLIDADDHAELVIRRIISSEGRSKAYINGVSVPLQQLKSIASFLISVHGQHAHQQLLKPDVQRKLLDDFAEHTPLVLKVKQQFQQLASARSDYEQLLAGQQIRIDRRSLLQYQVQELDEFNIGENEFVELETEP